MITKLFIPKLGMTMEKATIAQWRYRHGDRVEKDAPVLVIDTEKVANEIEAPVAGRLVMRNWRRSPSGSTPPRVITLSMPRTATVL